MPKITDLLSRKYVGKDDLVDGPIIATIKRVVKENLAKEEDEADEKWVLHFEDPVKPLVLNATNRDTLIELFEGCKTTEEWSGKQVELWVDETVKYAGKKVGGVRVRECPVPF